DTRVSLTYSHPSRSALFPYTTLFRSAENCTCEKDSERPILHGELQAANDRYGLGLLNDRLRYRGKSDKRTKWKKNDGQPAKQADCRAARRGGTVSRLTIHISAYDRRRNCDQKADEQKNLAASRDAISLMIIAGKLCAPCAVGNGNERITKIDRGDPDEQIEVRYLT